MNYGFILNFSVELKEAMNLETIAVCSEVFQVIKFEMQIDTVIWTIVSVLRIGFMDWLYTLNYFFNEMMRKIII